VVLGAFMLVAFGESRRARRGDPINLPAENPDPYAFPVAPDPVLVPVARTVPLGRHAAMDGGLS
jgi:hypothetical protein